MPIRCQKPVAIGPIKAEDDARLFGRPAFYAEFAARADQVALVDSIYVLKDRGLLTASRMSFASPLRELTFVFRQDDPGGRVVFNAPSSDCRRKSRAFFGWIVGVKLKPNWPCSPSNNHPAIVACRDALARIIRNSSSRFDILDTIDQTLLALAPQEAHGSIGGRDPLDAPHDRVSDLADHVGRSVRTLRGA